MILQCHDLEDTPGMAFYRGHTYKFIIPIVCCVCVILCEQVRFYSLHTNLDNAQILDCLKVTSPIIKLNLHGNYLFLATHDCHVTVIGLNLQFLPNKGKYIILDTAEITT